MTEQNVLIVGANGKTGTRVQARLQNAGVRTRGVSRSTIPGFDWHQPDAWEAALEGTTAAYLTYHPDLSVPEAEGHIRDFCNLAVRHGLEHVVLLSGRGEEGAARAEQVLRQSGLRWNVVQASWFAQNFSESFMLDGILAGQLVLPAGAVSEPFVDIDDIADVVVATLLEPGLHNRLFEVTGPQLLTFADCISDIREAAGIKVELLEVPLDDYIRALREQGLPGELVTILRGLFNELFDGRNAHTADGVRDAIGRPATDFRDYARQTAATGVWHQRQMGRVS